MLETIRVDWLTANPRGCVYIRASLSRARESTAAPQTAAHASAAMRLGKRRFEAWPCAHTVSSRRALAGARHRATRLTCSPGRMARRAPSWRACERSAASLRPHRCVSSRALSAAARDGRHERLERHRFGPTSICPLCRASDRLKSGLGAFFNPRRLSYPSRGGDNYYYYIEFLFIIIRPNFCRIPFSWLPHFGVLWSCIRRCP